MNKKDIGNYGEYLAKIFLKNNGYIIIDCNYRLSRLEIDIIGKKDDKIVLFEIKTRQKNNSNLSDYPLTQRQSSNLKKAARLYSVQNNISFDIISYDLILILIDSINNKALIRHYQNIF